MKKLFLFFIFFVFNNFIWGLAADNRGLTHHSWNSNHNDDQDDVEYESDDEDEYEDDEFEEVDNNQNTQSNQIMENNKEKADKFFTLSAKILFIPSAIVAFYF
jgi:hypothetical protein